MHASTRVRSQDVSKAFDRLHSYRLAARPILARKILTAHDRNELTKIARDVGSIVDQFASTSSVGSAARGVHAILVAESGDTSQALMLAGRYLEEGVNHKEAGRLLALESHVDVQTFISMISRADNPRLDIAQQAGIAAEATNLLQRLCDRAGRDFERFPSHPLLGYWAITSHVLLHRHLTIANASSDGLADEDGTQRREALSRASDFAARYPQLDEMSSSDDLRWAVANAHEFDQLFPADTDDPYTSIRAVLRARHDHAEDLASSMKDRPTEVPLLKGPAEESWARALGKKVTERAIEKIVVIIAGIFAAVVTMILLNEMGVNVVQVLQLMKTAGGSIAHTGGVQLNDILTQVTTGLAYHTGGV